MSAKSDELVNCLYVYLFHIFFHWRSEQALPHLLNKILLLNICQKTNFVIQNTFDFILHHYKRTSYMNHHDIDHVDLIHKTKILTTYSWMASDTGILFTPASCRSCVNCFCKLWTWEDIFKDKVFSKIEMPEQPPKGRWWILFV